jgi:hypothetical protein
MGLSWLHNRATVGCCNNRDPHSCCHCGMLDSEILRLDPQSTTHLARVMTRCCLRRKDRNPLWGMGSGSAVGADVYLCEGKAAVSATSNRVTADAARLWGLRLVTPGLPPAPPPKTAELGVMSFGEGRGS